MKKLLYNHWNYLSDKVGISSPDGGFSYLWSIFQEFQKRGWGIYNIVNRDKESVIKYGKECFKAFSQDKRCNVYTKLKFVGLEECLNGQLPDVDLVILEWRFPTKDNQLSPDAPGYSPDLQIQEKLIDFYRNKGTPIVIFDLDYNLTKEDEEKVKPTKVLEQGLKPKDGHQTVFIPFDFSDILQFSTEIPYRNNLLTYVGNDYNRREDIEKKIIPISEKYPGQVHFWGNWMKDDKKELREKWKHIIFHDRIGAQQFRDALSRSVASPLLATDEYKEHGHMTMRILEILLFGSIPIGFSDFYGIEKFLPGELIIDTDDYKRSSEEVINYLVNLGFLDRITLRKDLAKRLDFMDVSHFVNVVLGGIK